VHFKGLVGLILASQKPRYANRIRVRGTKLRETDESSKNAKHFDSKVLLSGGEAVPLV
jgi:hypothetical protein